MRSVNIILLIIFVVIASCSKDQSKDFTEFPVHPEAINAHYSKDLIAKGVVSLTYNVEIPFPAIEITNFIENDVTKKGFIRYDIPFKALPSFKWSNFNPKTGEWEETNTIPARYSANWVNESRNEIIWIVVDYSSATKTEDWQNTAHVSLQITSFSQFKKEMEAIRESNV